MAQSWLVLRLTGSGAGLGLVAAAQFLPRRAAGGGRRALSGASPAAPARSAPPPGPGAAAPAGPYGGLVAGRAGKRRLMATQSAWAVCPRRRGC
ncbi:hypothetical protein [Streptomyces shenzhenensis]|uniref:hypothetical protein n=1 Tax=Streptomyces shenzhenensis TaxID=943815 RepID=UPI001F3FB470|nr:hypothetical protein [Streptomyces shenzhenensis]